MDKNRDILEQEALRKRPFTVPEGYFDALKERLGAIPREAEPVAEKPVAHLLEPIQKPKESAQKGWIRPAMVWAAGVAALLAVGVWVFSRSGAPADPSALEVLSYEEMAYSDLIPRTDPYIYFADEVEQPEDPEREEIIDYLLQNPLY